MEKTQKGGGVIAAILGVFSTVLLFSIFIVGLIFLSRPIEREITPEQEALNLANFERNYEEVVVRDQLSRDLLKKNPERLVECMHINDVYYNTNLCDGIKEEKLITQLEADPVLASRYSEKYFQYLEQKYDK